MIFEIVFSYLNIKPAQDLSFTSTKLHFQVQYLLWLSFPDQHGSILGFQTACFELFVKILSRFNQGLFAGDFISASFLMLWN